MRPVGFVLVVVLAALAISAAVSFALGDRQTLVPPPDAEAESFGRTLAMGRIDRARAHLTDDLRGRLTDEDLRAHGRRLSAGPGTVWDVRAETDRIAGDLATATVVCRGGTGESALEVELRRESGLWRIARLGPD